METALNEEQRTRVCEHASWARSLARRWDRTDDEWESIAMLALCQAALKWEGRKLNVTFKVLAWQAIHDAFRQEAAARSKAQLDGEMDRRACSQEPEIDEVELAQLRDLVAAFKRDSLALQTVYKQAKGSWKRFRGLLVRAQRLFDTEAA